MIIFFKKILPWVVPEKLISFIRKIAIFLKINFFDFKGNKILSVNRVLKDSYKGERCFIIGNGTSINKLDMLKLKNEYTFSMNSFIKHDQLEQINPTFHSVIEPFNLMNNYAKNCEYNPENYYPQIERALKNLDTILFFHYGCKNFFEKNGLFKNKKVYYLKASSNFSEDKKYSIKSCSDISKPFSFMNGSIHSAICCCAYMGFRELYLIGFDADYILKNGKSNFHEEPEKILKDGIKKYTWSVPENEGNKTLAYHLYVYLSETEIVKDYFEPKGVKIYNAGIGGFLDTFERVDFNKLF